jgi:hypothetical protein
MGEGALVDAADAGALRPGDAGAKWFSGGRLNYADALLHPSSEVDPASVAVVVAAEDVADREVTWSPPCCPTVSKRWSRCWR